MFGFSAASLSLTRDGGSNLLTADQTLTPSTSNSWSLQNLSALTNVPGSYRLVLSAKGITDLAGNAPVQDVVAQWNYDPLQGTAADDTYLLKADPDGKEIDYWLNNSGVAPTGRLPGTLASLAIHGMGGNDTVIVDQSGGDFLPPALTANTSGGTLNLKLIGTAGDDQVDLDGNAGRLDFGTKVIILSQLAGVEYDDGGGNDSVSVSGGVPLTLDVGSGNDLLNVDADATVRARIHATSGDLTINGEGNTLLEYI